MKVRVEIQDMKRSKIQVASFYERVANELDALANDIKVSSSVDLKLFHSLRKKARDIRAGATPMAVKLAEQTTRH
jgi:hypothetical protein